MEQATTGETPASLPRFHYFRGRGLGESIRFVLGAAGIEYQECFLTKRKDFTDLLDSGKLLFDQVPLLEMDGLHLVQSNAILRYLARKYKLYGINEKQAVQCDMIAESCTDFILGFYIGIPFGIEKGTSQEMIEKLLTVGVPKYFKKWEQILSQNKTAFFVGDQMTYVDPVVLRSVLECIEYDAKCIDPYPNLRSWFSSIQSFPTISAFLKSSHRMPPSNAVYANEVRLVLDRKI